jgi:hypothetical protein
MRAAAAALIALGACGPRAGPAPRPPPAARPASMADGLPAEPVAAIRAPAAGAPMLAFFARSPRRPPCVDAALAGVRETLQLQRDRAERMVLVLAGAIDRDRLEACGVETARALFGVEVSARREGALTMFESGGGAQVAGFAEGRAVLADTAEQVRWVLQPARALGPADPLGPLLPRLAAGEVAAITTIDYLAPWTKIPARATSFRLERRPALRAETRVQYGGAEDARHARDALARIRASDEVPFAIRRTLALLDVSVDGAELVFDLAPLLAPAHAVLLQSLMRELGPPPRTR